MNLSLRTVIALIMMASVAGARAQAQLADFGDAPDNTLDPTVEAYPGVPGRFPSLLNTGNAAPGNQGAHHPTVNGEWLGATGISAPSTTVEADAKLVDADDDDAVVQILCALTPPAPPAGPLSLCYLRVEAIHVASGAPDVPRYVNALVDLNRDGTWRSAVPFGTFPREHVVIDKEIVVSPGGTPHTLMGGPIIVPSAGPVWVRVTLTREKLNLQDWDGSAPAGGFAFGETEDHLVTPSSNFLGPVNPAKEPPTNFEIRVTPNPVIVPAMPGAPLPEPFTVDVIRKKAAAIGGQTPATLVTVRIDRCQTIQFDPGSVPGITINGIAGALFAGGIVLDQGWIEGSAIPVAAPPPPLPVAIASIVFGAKFTPPIDHRVAICRASLVVDPEEEFVEYDTPIGSELTIRFLEPDVPDSDGDGLPDSSDLCPDEPEDLDGFQDDDGCPDPDNDEDGVLDEDDLCPADKGPADNRGCPKPGQSTTQQSCINALNTKAIKVAATQAAENARCVADAGKGKVTDAQACLTADPKGKVAKAEAATLADEGKRCVAGALPDIGYSSGQTANAAARGQEIALVADVFGSDLNAAIIPSAVDKVAARCQAAVIKDYENISSTKLMEFLKCKKKGLKNRSIVSGASLEACLGVDPSGKVAKAVAKLSADLTKKCSGVDVAAAFPGECSAATHFTTCVEQRVECRVCLMMNAADGLSRSCDVFDDGVLNATCPPAPPPSCNFHQPECINQQLCSCSVAAGQVLQFSFGWAWNPPAPDRPICTWAAALPPGASYPSVGGIGSVTGVFSWTPMSSDVGQHDFTTQAGAVCFAPEASATVHITVTSSTNPLSRMTSGASGPTARHVKASVARKE